ncbi:type II toxin-antitoxin system prevent-host-death family antitoxin [Brevundimonas sp.]|uniref:type II toxin-antitoxin system Phd/YefM family antitoxin n=1 Tax=Brevundimonas sp. TaxID=1871086 RepID=UPI001D844FD7|nr:type II toxin-antitoxin system prevent-host-death family antitoxin [Brevundimonas sp.]MBA4001052.1 type II toxin-antitoxin system prevent-host-death family antitoxin [Brevundimonas sp.]
MTIQVNIAKAKATLSELVALAESGEEVVLARAGKPVVTLKLVADVDPSSHRRIGAFADTGLTEEEARLFLGPDPAFDQDKPELY